MRQDINEEMHQNFLKETDMMFLFGLPSKWNLFIISHWWFKHKPCLEGRTTTYKLLHNSSSVKNTQASRWEASWEKNPIQHPFCANSKGFFCLPQHSSILSLLLCLYSNSLKYCPRNPQAWQYLCHCTRVLAWRPESFLQGKNCFLTRRRTSRQQVKQKITVITPNQTLSK